MISLSKTTQSILDLSLKDNTASLGLALSLTFDICNKKDFKECYDEDTTFFLKIEYFDNTNTNLKCVHRLDEQVITVLLSQENDIQFISFNKLIQSINLICEPLQIKMNLFEKYAKAEILIKQPKLSLIDHMNLSITSFKFLKNENKSLTHLTQSLLNRLNDKEIFERIEKLETLYKLLSEESKSYNDKFFIQEALNEHLTNRINNFEEKFKESTEQIKNLQEFQVSSEEKFNHMIETDLNEIIDTLNSKVDSNELTDVMKKIEEIKPVAHKHEMTDINDFNDEINTIISSFEKIQQNLLEKNNSELKNEVNNIVTEKINNSTDLQKSEILVNFISNKSYFHIGEVIIPEKDKNTAWIKVLTNINFPKVNQEIRKPILLTNLDMFQLQIRSENKMLLKFITGTYLPKGPKDSLDFPIGHKQFEWLEAELHLQFDISNVEGKCNILYNNIPVAETMITNYDNKDWRHYYMNLSSFVPNKNS